MRTYIIKPATATIFSALIIALTLTDFGLTIFAVREHRQIVRLSPRPVGGMTPGVAVPTLIGTSLANNEAWRVTPSGSKGLVLLVFRESCHFCEINWTSWNALFGLGSKVRPVLVTLDPSVSQQYQVTHPLVTSALTLTAVGKDTVGALDLNLTPQTIIIRNGVVEHDWVGVLNSDQIAQVKTTLAAMR